MDPILGITCAFLVFVGLHICSVLRWDFPSQDTPKESATYTFILLAFAVGVMLASFRFVLIGQEHSLAWVCLIAIPISFGINMMKFIRRGSFSGEQPWPGKTAKIIIMLIVIAIIPNYCVLFLIEGQDFSFFPMSLWLLWGGGFAVGMFLEIGIFLISFRRLKMPIKVAAS